MRQKLGFAFCIALVGLVILATRFYEVDIPVWHFFGGGQRLDPASLHLAGEFVESNLGTVRELDGSYTVRMLAQQYVFVPHCVVVPSGVTVRFRMTSADSVHTLNVAGTDLKLEAVPGTVSQMTTQFAKAGEFEAPCREFCGAGHFAMRAKVEVVLPEQFGEMGTEQRRTCEPQ